MQSFQGNDLYLNWIDSKKNWGKVDSKELEKSLNRGVNPETVAGFIATNMLSSKGMNWDLFIDRMNYQTFEEWKYALDCLFMIILDQSAGQRKGFYEHLEDPEKTFRTEKIGHTAMCLVKRLIINGWKNE